MSYGIAGKAVAVMPAQVAGSIPAAFLPIQLPAKWPANGEQTAENGPGVWAPDSHMGDPE